MDNQFRFYNTLTRKIETVIPHRAIMEAVMLDLMYHVPSDNSIKECVVDADMVDGILHGNKDLEKLAS